MDSEREKFRTYVEKSGVMSALTDVLVHLYEEPDRPSDALQYIKTALGTMTVDNERLQMYEEKVKEQKTTIETLQANVESLQSENSSLKERISQLEAKLEEPKAAPEDAAKA
ncbi:c-Myc-binding protein [Penaeus vannamei]|nr:c-Myc-binding protein-like [Penaeus vannamei]